jgi:integrase
MEAISKKLGRPHVAHLRAVAQGLSIAQAASTYLLTENAYGAQKLHASIVDRARAIARQAGYADWRLIGIEIHRPAAPVSTASTVSAASSQAGQAGQALSQAPPPIEAWAEQNGLDGWRYEELVEMYQAAFPNAGGGKRADRKASRNARLHARQLAVVNLLEQTRVADAQATDPVADWFDRITTKRFVDIGVLALADLQDVMARQPRWWTLFRAIGAKKGARIQSFMRALLPASTAEGATRPWDVALRDVGERAARETREVREASALAAPTGGSLVEAAFAPPENPRERLDGATGWNRDASPLVTATTDTEIIASWISARGVNAITALAYRREARRLYLWCVVERQRALSSMDAEDCAAYARFIAAIPASWIGVKVSVTQRARWAPFATQLSAASQRQALSIIKGFFDWLQRAGYIKRNPWVLVAAKVQADTLDIQALLHTRALTPEASAALRAYLEDNPDNHRAKSRARFCVAFCESTGLRSTELLKAKLGDITKDNTGAWCLPLIGKGGKPRVVALPPDALTSLRWYLQQRGLPTLIECVESIALRDLPIVPSVVAATAHVGYQAFYQSITRIVRRGIKESGLSREEKRVAMRASPHWLRHTFATRAKERKVSNEVLMLQLGHADERPLMRYTKAQRHLLNAELAQAFSASS